jgi:hypothetical protein
MSRKPLFTVEDVRRVNQKMIDEYNNKQRGRIMSLPDVMNLPSGTVMKAIDKYGFGIIFDLAYVHAQGNNIIYKTHFLHIVNKAPAGFDESKHIACDYTMLKYLDIADEATVRNFHETIKMIEETNQQSEKSVQRNDNVLSKDSLKNMIDRVLVVKTIHSCWMFIIRYRGMTENGGLLTDEVFFYEQCKIHIFIKSEVIASYFDVDMLSEASSELECMFCEQISAETHKNSNPLNYKTIRKYQPGDYMYVRTDDGKRYLFRWGYFDFNNNRIMALGNIHYSYYKSGLPDKYCSMMFEEIHGNREELQFRLLDDDSIEIAEIREMTPIEYEYYEYELREYYKTDSYSEDEVAGTPTDQTFCGILKDGTVVKFILHDSYYENDSNDENLQIVPALPYKRDDKWWATQIDGNKREFSYKEFDKIWYASKTEDYFFKEDFWKNGGSRDIKHDWSLVLPSESIKRSKLKSSKTVRSSKKKIVQFKDDSDMRPFVTKVMMNKGHGHRWIPAIFGYKGFCDGSDKLGYVAVGGASYAYCVPWQKNKEFIGKMFCHSDFES